MKWLAFYAASVTMLLAATGLALADRNVTIERHTPEQHAALSLIDMGVMDWMVICAYVSGQEGIAREQMIKQCTMERTAKDRK